MKSGYLKPTTKGLRGVQDNGSPNDMIVNPPRYAELGGLKSAKKFGGKNTMRVGKPGTTEHK